MNRILSFLRSLFSNFYLGTGTLFLVWISFFDGNDLWSLAQNHIELARTESEILYYQSKIQEVAQEQHLLNGSLDAQEKFARERYLMKKENEDVFVIEELKKGSILSRLGSE